MRVSGHVARVAIATAMLLGLAVPAYADPGDTSIPAERAGDDRATVPADPAARADRASRIDQARRTVLDDSYQAELPHYRDPSGSPGAGSGGAGGPLRLRRQAGGELGDGERDRRMMIDAREHEERGASSLMSFLMWGMVIVVGVLLAFWIASELSRYGGDAELSPADEPAGRMHAAAEAIIDRPLGMTLGAVLRSLVVDEAAPGRSASI